MRSIVASARLVGAALGALVLLCAFQAGPANATSPEWTLESPPSPQAEADGALRDVSCASAYFCLAVGYDEYADRDFAETWDGESWTAHKGGADEYARAVSCGAEYVCLAIGAYNDGEPLVEVWSEWETGWEGSALTEPVLPEGGSNLQLYDVSCAAALDCAAVGSYTKQGKTTIVAERLIGLEWQVQESDEAQGALEEVSCLSAEDCVAVGYEGSGSSRKPLVERLDGEAWSAESAPSPAGENPSLRALSCVSATYCLASGAYYDAQAKEQRAFALSYDGSSWSQIAAPGAAAGVEALSCGAEDACLAVGQSGSAPAAQTWDGSQWSVESPPAGEGSATLVGVSCVAPLSCAAVGRTYAEERSEPLAERYESRLPEVEVEDVLAVKAESATFTARVNPHGLPTEYQFEYGPTAAYGASVPMPAKALDSEHVGSATPTNLDEATTYHYRVVATNESGTAVGQDRTFTTLDPPQTTITSPQLSYTSHETSSIEFASDETGSTFKCRLAEGGAGNESLQPCQSPYELPKTLGLTWQLFEVVAIDGEGNADPTPAKWSFNPGIYPPAPTSSKLTSPDEGDKSSSYFTLQSEWGSPPQGGGVTGVAYQVKLPTWDAFKTIPAQYVRDSQGKQVSWPIPVSENPGHSAPAFFDAKSYGEAQGWAFVQDVSLRAVFDGGVSAAGASAPVSAVFNRFASSPSDATEAVGPVNLDLVTGSFTIKRTDVSIPVPGSDANLEFTRVYNSAYGASEKTNSKVLGEKWQPSAPVESEYEEEAWQKILVQHQDYIPPKYDSACEKEQEEIEAELKEYGEWTGPLDPEECLEEYAVPAADWVEVLVNEGVGISFDKVGDDYVAPEEAKEYKLTKSGEAFVLADLNGTRTEFTQNGETNEYVPKSVSFQGTSKEARLVYDVDEGKKRLSQIIAPSLSGVTCNPFYSEGHWARETPGCRTLVFHYTGFYCVSRYEDRLDQITYYNATGSSHQTVASYGYGRQSSCDIEEEWDPRISPQLKEVYHYQMEGYSRLTSMKSPGVEPWYFDYYGSPGPNYEAKLKSVSRASLLESEPTATTTIAYDVPISGEGAPYDLSPAAISQWGQSDYPVDATAVFPPTEIPGEHPSDYSGATIHYLDPDGYEVNTATPAPPGAEGDSIATTETDRHGDVVRELDPQNRLEALGAEDPAARSRELDSHSVYSEDGTELLESWGPLHPVRREWGMPTEARLHTTIHYDQGASTEAGEPAPHLPTSEKTAAITPGLAEEFDQRETETKYDWTLRKPTEEIVEPNAIDYQLRTVTAYDKATGQVAETRMPANPQGTDAHSTHTAYYTATGSGGCGNHPAWAGLPCFTRHVAGNEEGWTATEVPSVYYAAYSNLDQPTEIREETGSAFHEGVFLDRTTTMTYDAAGRPTKTKVAGEGARLPALETAYSPTTGAPEAQRFLCEAPESCAGYDAQQTRTAYDKLGRPVEYEDADGAKSGLAYDLMGRPVASADGKGYQEIEYDPASGLPVELRDSAAGTFTAAYDADGRMTEQTLPDGLAQKIAYGPDGAAASLRYVKETGCSAGCEWLRFQREYSINGQVLNEEGTLGEAEYLYDRAGRLIRATEDPSGPGCAARYYAYDKDSNRASMIARRCDPESEEEAEPQETETTYEYDNADRLIGAGVEYDRLGRITSLPAKYAGGGRGRRRGATRVGVSWIEGSGGAELATDGASEARPDLLVAGTAET